MLIEKLTDSGICDALKELGFAPEKMFADAGKQAQELYCSYSWVKSQCSVPGVDKAYVINAIPPDFDHLAWEEWYASRGELIHHILCASPWPECTDEAVIPADDRDHPALICGRKWYYFEDTDLHPYFARAEK